MQLTMNMGKQPGPFQAPEWSENTLPPSETLLGRTDAVTEAIVEEGLEILRTDGLKKAAEFLVGKMVPLNVATRVLLRPAERRKPKMALPAAV
jgi:hypothetical protein